MSNERKDWRRDPAAGTSRLLFINQYYWPDHASTAQHLTDLAESLAEHLPIETGTRVLLPESAIARPTLADRLSARGARV